MRTTVEITGVYKNTNHCYINTTGIVGKQTLHFYEAVCNRFKYQCHIQTVKLPDIKTLQFQDI